MNNFFKYLDGQSLLNDDCLDTETTREYQFPNNVSGKEAKEAIRFLQKEGVSFEEVYTSNGFIYQAHFRTKTHCQIGRLERSIRYWLLDYCLGNSQDYDITVQRDRVISYSKKAKDCDFIITIQRPKVAS